MKSIVKKQLVVEFNSEEAKELLVWLKEEFPWYAEDEFKPVGDLIGILSNFTEED